jgi:hypothetical protein
MKTLLTLSVALIAGLGADAQSQTKPSTSRPDSTCVFFPDGRRECVKVREFVGDSGFGRMFLRDDSAMMNRAALGIELRPTGTRRDTLGVFVAAVTKGGPAEAAGIIEGDRIAAINGVDLRTAAGDVDDSYTNRLSSHRLTREVQKLSPGTRVTLRVYSNGRFRDVTVTTGRASELLRQAGRFNLRIGPGDFQWRGMDDAMIFTPQMPLRIERLKRPGRTEIRTLRPRIEREIIA